MITKDEIRSIPHLHRQIERDRQHLTFLREKATCIPSGLGGDADRVQHSTENRAGIYVDAAADLAREIAEMESELQELQTRAAEYIKILPVNLRRLLTYRYIECLGWDDVADIMGYTLRHVHRIETEALSALD